MKTKYAIAALLAIACLFPGLAFAEDYDYEYEYEYEYPETPQTINTYDGIYWYGDRLETYYSSEVAYHYRTDEWWLDDEGFYRTDEGYYVVAVCEYEMEEGTVFEGSKGLCQVLDCGCDYGITDYYVCW